MTNEVKTQQGWELSAAEPKNPTLSLFLKRYDSIPKTSPSKSLLWLVVKHRRGS